jgi:hypothetical protein
MRHDWMIDVLADLHDYATRNGLPTLARKIEEAQALARADLAGEAAEDPPPSAPAGARRAQ